MAGGRLRARRGRRADQRVAGGAERPPRAQRTPHGAVQQGPEGLLQLHHREGGRFLARALRPRHHRPPRRSLLRVLQPGRVELRAAGRGLRGVRGDRRVRLRHDEHRLLGGALRRVPEDTHLQRDPLRDRPLRLRRADNRRGRVQGGEDRPPRQLGARLPSGQLGDVAARAHVRPRPDGHPQHLLRAAPPPRAAGAARDALSPHAGRAGQGGVRAVGDGGRVRRARSTRARTAR